MTGDIAAGVIGYLLGAIPFGLLLTWIAGYGDLRKIGSGNIGATNVLRTGNKALAALTVLLDVGKGVAAVLIGARWGVDAMLAAAGAVILGHMFPVWLMFRGGKAVATGLGVLIVVAWPVALVAGVVWLAAAVMFRYSSLAAFVACAVAAAYSGFVLDGHRAELITAIALAIIVKHHENIRRLLAGTESRISFTKS
ncbi:MAG TPA: glycerol-3-phosphate 1-O-acyltransferase PlsY [Stellaceae bacterium]|jgi:glycerol-3-phosphate acyltransferase PlsY|nr:glycerol-3-phosphate 1-O-acyltransferase PlsY [Stellaceae bacterium]